MIILTHETITKGLSLPGTHEVIIKGFIHDLFIPINTGAGHQR